MMFLNFMKSCKEKMIKTKRENWVDVLKLFSILAVFVDHTNGFLYTDSRIAVLSYFSTGLFVFLGGGCAFGAEIRHINEPYLLNFYHKSKRLLATYLIGTLFYCWFAAKRIDLISFLQYTVNFSAAAIFYYVVFYVQLLFVSRLLYCIICRAGNSKYPVFFHLINTIVIAVLSSLFIRYTYILPVHGGGQYFCGGTFLFCYYLGMLFFAYKDRVKWTKKKSLVMCVISIIVLCAWILYMFKFGYVLDGYIKYFGSFNPPGPTQIIYLILIVLSGWSVHTLVDSFDISILKKFEAALGWLGRHTLYIFVFHLLVINYIRNTPFGFAIASNIHLCRIVYLAAILFIPIFIEYMIQFIIRWLKDILVNCGNSI